MALGLDQFISPGTKVLYDGTGVPEYGVVVHCWLDEFGAYDCYVAFFGDEMPTSGKPKCRPYILRYFANSLNEIE